MSTGNMPTAAKGAKCQYGPETAWGTKVAATVALGAIDLKPAPEIESTAFAPKGKLMKSVVSYGDENGKISFEGPATYEEAGAFSPSVKSILDTVIPANTYEAGGLIFPGGVIAGWTMTGNTKEIKLSGSILSKSFEVGAATTPLSSVAQTPMVNDDVTITLGGVEITNALSWELAVSNIWVLAHFVGDKNAGGINQGEVEATFKIGLEASSTNLARISTRTELPLIINIVNGTKSWKAECNVQLQSTDPLEAVGEIYGMTLNYLIKDGTDPSLKVTAVAA